MADSTLLDPMLRKLGSRAPLDADDRAAMLDLPYRRETFEPDAYVIREGQRPERSCLILSGFVFRHKVTIDGLRQIVSVHMPADFIDVGGALLDISDHNVQSLTRCELAIFPRAAIQAVVLSRPRIAAALWIDTLIDGSIFREWITNLGRRNARSRVAHLVCELARRLEVAGLAEEYGYELPMTQEQLADATGLTPVHVNRVLMALSRDGLIARQKRFVRIPDWTALSEVAGFSETYLHLDLVPRVGATS